MSHSTTSKSIFSLTKYSRALFQQLDGQKASQNSRECNWQHHSQPTLRLLLELRKSAQGILESVRLRVVWTVEKGQSAKIAQQDNMVLEDVDLLIIRNHVHPFSTQGLPLKAVYRDNLVGIRYLPPNAKSNTPSEYHRFQITFQSPTDSVTLVSAIRDICPCKPSPSNNPVGTGALGTSGPTRLERHDSMYGSQQTQTPFPMQIPPHMLQTPSRNRASVMMTASHYSNSNDRIPPSSLTKPAISDLPIEFSLPYQRSHQNAFTHSDEPRLQSSSICLTPQSRQSLSRESTRFDLSSSPFYPQSFQLPELRSRHTSITTDDINMHSTIERQSGPNISRSVLIPTPPPSSQTTGALDISGVNLTSRKETAENTPVDTGGGEEDTSIAASGTAPKKSSIIESLYDACRLDHLPQDELEQLVAHIVREDGFTDLVEKLDSMWQLKAVVNL